MYSRHCRSNLQLILCHRQHETLTQKTAKIHIIILFLLLVDLCELKPYVPQHGLLSRRKAVRWVSASIGKLLLALLCLSLLDILVTVPVYEANPITLYLWGRIGVFLSALLKIGLVLLFAVLCQLTKMAATSTEWAFSRRLLEGILFLLVAFYVFVVLWNTALLVSIKL